MDRKYLSGNSDRTNSVGQEEVEREDGETARSGQRGRSVIEMEMDARH